MADLGSESTKLYVVYNVVYCSVVAVYTTKERAIALCARVAKAAIEAGWAKPEMVAEWEEIELDAEPAVIRPY